MPKSFRLSQRSERDLRRLSDRLGRNQTDVIELALRHLLGTLDAGEGVHLEARDDEEED